MAGIPDVFTEVVNGEIIGGNECYGDLYYKGKLARGNLLGDTESALIERAKVVKHQLIDQVSFLFHDDDNWELRIHE